MKKHGEPITILMADDDADDRRLTRDALEESRLANDLRFVENGEEAFRELERAAVAGALKEDGTLREHGGVLALGSGAVLGEAVQHLLNGLPVVYLSASFNTVARRVGLDRPRVVVPGNPRGRLRAMLDERDALYRRLASVTVPTDDLDLDEVVDEVAARIKEK